MGDKIIEIISGVILAGVGALITHLLHRSKDKAEQQRVIAEEQKALAEAEKTKAETTHVELHNASDIAQMWSAYVSEIKEQQRCTKQIVEKLEEKYSHLQTLYEQLRSDYFELKRENENLKTKIVALEQENETLKMVVNNSGCKYNPD